MYLGHLLWSASPMTGNSSEHIKSSHSRDTACKKFYLDHVSAVCMSTYIFLFPKDCEDHAALLCSLLLGFGLNAYVCIGTKAKGAAHSWVMTISPEGEVIFWESLTAHRYCPNLCSAPL